MFNVSLAASGVISSPEGLSPRCCNETLVQLLVVATATFESDRDAAKACIQRAVALLQDSASQKKGHRRNLEIRLRKAALAGWIALASFGAAQAGPADADGVHGARIENSYAEARNWLSYGRTYSEQRFSPLKKINAENATSLGLAWFADLDTNRGQEATPLVVDGVLYISTAWSIVKAYEGRTGRLLWSYDPAVPRELGVNACCDTVSRGVAAWNRKIFVGTFDGRLVALDAATGKDGRLP